MDFIKKNWMGFLVILVFLFFMFAPKGCVNKIRGDASGVDTVSVKTNTVYVPQPPVYVPQYVPVQSGGTNYPVVIPPSYNPSTDIAKLTDQYNALVKEFLAERKYQDSVTLKDSTGRRVGVFNNNDLVSANKIQSRAPSYQLDVAHTTTTITIREPYVPRNQVYLGLGIKGSLQQPVNGAHVGLAFKNKKDQIYQAQGGFIVDPNGQLKPQFDLSTYFKLKFGKK